METHLNKTRPPTGAAASAPNSSKLLALQPVAFRLPKPGTADPYFGGSRSFWNAHVLPSQSNNFRPPVKSVVRRQPGATRGIRFILFDSAREFFLKLAQDQEQSAPVTN